MVMHLWQTIFTDNKNVLLGYFPRNFICREHFSVKQCNAVVEICHLQGGEMDLILSINVPEVTTLLPIVLMKIYRNAMGNF